MKMRIAIIGTGISGLSVANLLKDKHEVILFDHQERNGGLIKCDIVDSVLFHKVGGHVFNSKNKKVSDWFWSYFDKEKEFIQVKRNAKILFQNKIIGYPIENYIYNLDKETVSRIIDELLCLDRGDKISPLEYANFEDFLKYNFGDTLYNLYFKPYNTKIWNTDLSVIPMPWLEGKLPMPDLKDILLNNITKEEESQMVHSTFFYPKTGGSQFIVDRLSEGLDIRLSEDTSLLQKKEKGFSLSGEDNFDQIIYCGDIRKMPNYMDNLVSQTVDIRKIKSLNTNGTSNLLCETDDNDVSWLYIPEPFTCAHRIIYTGNFSSVNNGNRKRKTCVVEFSGEVEYEKMIHEIKKLPGNLTPITYNYEPSSYVIHNFDTRGLIEKTKKVLATENIFLLGRFAEWEYYNMDKCIEAAMQLVNPKI